MSEGAVFLVILATTWLSIGLALSIVMGRRGHNSFGWLVLGSVLGPLGIVLAVGARRHDERMQPAPLNYVAAPAGTGPVDVLIGYDGSSESAAAVETVTELLGDRLGRLTVATVVSYGGIREEELLAKHGLRDLADRKRGRALELEVLHGHPSEALRQHAIAGGYELIAVGSRGAGISKAILGSAASELARESKVPVLITGGTPNGLPLRETHDRAQMTSWLPGMRSKAR